MSIEKPEFKIENNEEPNKYTYRDKSAGDEIVFECIAKNILEADEMYEAKTGKNPAKQNYVGCSFEKLESDTLKK